MRLARSAHRLLGAAVVPLFALVAASGCGGGGRSTGGDAASDGARRDASHVDADGASKHPDAGHDAGHEAAADAGPPYLVALAVTGAASALVPAFSSGTYDYYVRCGSAGANALSVSMTASPGTTSLLTQPTPSASAPQQTVAVSAMANQAVVAEAKSLTTGATTDYWVRCLPPDFPVLGMTAYPEAGTPTPGYYVTGNAGFIPPEAGYAMILNGDGVPVWYRAMGPGLAAGDVEPIGDGGVSFLPVTFPTPYNPIYPFEVEQLSPLATTTIAPNGYGPAGYESDEHELRLLPNGHYLTFTSNLAGPFDLTGVVIPVPGDDGGIKVEGKALIQDCTVLEVDDSGHIFWQWSASDHFDPAKVSTYASTAFGPTPADAGTVYDLFHCDSIDVDPANGNLLISARNMSSVFYIDRAPDGGSVAWKMGGIDSSKDHATFVSVASPFLEQHDGRLQGWLSNCNGGTGQVSVIDDETGGGGTPARGVIYDVVVGGGDGGCTGATFDGGAPAPGTARLAWAYSNPAGSSSSGGGDVQVFSDGSHLVAWGITHPTATEVNPKEQAMRQLDFELDYSYRVIKVPLSAFDLSVLRTTAGQSP